MRGKADFSDTYPFSIRGEGDKRVVFNAQTKEVYGRYDRYSIEPERHVNRLVKERNERTSGVAA